MSIVKKIDFLLGDDLALEQTEFQKFFKKKLKQYGVNSPEDLGVNKKKFFNEVDREWKGKNESVSEASVEAIMMQFGPYAAAKKMGILNPKQSGPAGETKAYPGSSYQYFKPDKTDQKMEKKDKGVVKSFPGDPKAHYHPDTQDTKIPTKDKGTVKGFPGDPKTHFHPDQQDKKISGNKGDVTGFPGNVKAHYNPDKVDQKIPTKDKGVVKSFPGGSKEHFNPNAQDAKIPGDKTDVKGFPGDHKVRFDKSILGFSTDSRSNQIDPKPMAEQSTEDVEDTQKKFGPKGYAEKTGLMGKKKEKGKAMEELMKNENKNIFEAYERSILNPPTVTEKEWLAYEKAYGESLDEKWAEKVKIEKTGEHAGKSVEQLKKEIEALKGKEGNKEKMGELLFALRSKTGWKKGAGAAGLGGK